MRWMDQPRRRSCAHLRERVWQTHPDEAEVEVMSAHVQDGDGHGKLDGARHNHANETALTGLL